MELPETDATAALDALTLALMANCCQISLVIGHMHRFAAANEPDPAAPPPPAVLHDVLREVLRPLAQEHGVADIATAAQMLDSATQTISEELFIVDISRFQDDD